MGRRDLPVDARQLQLPAYGCKAQDEADKAADPEPRGSRHGHDDNGAYEGGGGVDLAVLAHDKGHLARVGVAHHAAADAGHKPHQHGRHGAHAELQGLVRAKHREVGEADGVADVDHEVELRVHAIGDEHEADEARDDGAVDEGGVLEPEHGDVQEHVAQGAAADGRHHGDHEDAEEIELGLAVAGRQNAAHGKGRHADHVDGEADDGIGIGNVAHGVFEVPERCSIGFGWVEFG